MSSVDITGAKRSALRVVRGQILATLIVAGIFLLWRGTTAGLSALAGGAIGVAAGLAMVAFMFRPVPADDPRRIVRNAYKGEAAKLGITVLLFIVALKFLTLEPLPLFVAYIAALAMHWIALAKIRQ